MTEFLIAALATWRLSFLLTQEEGPWRIFAKLRERLVNTMPGRALACLYCTSMWVAAPIALYMVPISVETIISWLGLSGTACLLHRATQRGIELIPLDP